jgi:hypothetical protein
LHGQAGRHGMESGPGRVDRVHGMMDSCHGSRRSSPPIQFLSVGPPPSPANKLCPNRPAIALMQLAAISPSRCLLLAAAGVDRYSHRIDQVGRPLACLHSCRPGPARPCMMHVVSMHFSSESTHLSMTPPCACVLMLSIVDPKFPTRISIAKRRKREVKNTCRRARTYVRTIPSISAGRATRFLVHMNSYLYIALCTCCCCSSSRNTYDTIGK